MEGNLPGKRVVFLCCTVPQLKLCLRKIIKIIRTEIHVSILLEDGSIDDLFFGNEEDFPFGILQQCTNEPMRIYRLFVRSIHDMPGGESERVVHWLSAPCAPTIETATDTMVRCVWPSIAPVGFEVQLPLAGSPILGRSPRNNMWRADDEDAGVNIEDGFAAYPADVLLLEETDFPWETSAKTLNKKSSKKALAQSSHDVDSERLDISKRASVWPQFIYQLEVAEGRKFNPSRLTKFPSTSIPMEFRCVAMGPNLRRVNTMELQPCHWYFFRLRIFTVSADGPGVDITSEVASAATNVSVPSFPARPKASIELVSNVSKARGWPQWRLRLHWTKPSSNGSPIRNYIVQQQVLGDGKDDRHYVHRPVSANFARPSTAFAAAVHRPGENLTDTEGWLIIYEKVLPECDVPIPQGIGFHQINLRVAAANGVGQSPYSENLSITYAKLMAILAEGDILASSIDKPPKLWIHHGKDRDGEDPKMLSEVKRIQESFNFPLSFDCILKFVKETEREKKFKEVKDRRRLHTAKPKPRRRTPQEQEMQYSDTDLALEDVDP